MNCRERVKAAMHYKPVDKVPLQYYYCPVGYYEHGDKLNDLYVCQMPMTFADYSAKKASTLLINVINKLDNII